MLYGAGRGLDGRVPVLGHLLLLVGLDPLLLLHVLSRRDLHLLVNPDRISRGEI